MVWDIYIPFLYGTIRWLTISKKKGCKDYNKKYKTINYKRANEIIINTYMRLYRFVLRELLVFYLIEKLDR